MSNQDLPFAPRLSRPYDARAKRSREALKNAFLQLLETHSLDQITIRQITQTAGLSYPVFFRQFQSKDGLLADLAREEVREILSMAREEFHPEQSESGLYSMCRHVESKKALWRTLLTAGAANEMRSEFALISAEIAAKGARTNPSLPVPLASSFAAAGIFAILAWWVSEGEEVPIHKVVHILEVLVAHPLTAPHEFSLG